MGMEYLNNANDIRDSFMKHFVLPWDDYKNIHNELIAKRNIRREWYDRAYMWEKMTADCIDASFEDALDYLRKRTGMVLCITEYGKSESFPGAESQDIIAKADPRYLAERIEYEWYESYRLAEQNKYIADSLPKDLYVFDKSMRWCVVFTHETDDLDAEEEGDVMKAAQSRYCLICMESDNSNCGSHL